MGNFNIHNYDVDISVILITYNQEKLVSDALDSILMQDTCLTIEVLVGEDCSQDETKHVLECYEKKYTERLKIIYNTNNVGASKNLYNLICQARGKYIAMLEGDDYWLNKKRLQILYEFLENNLDCAGVSHIRERRTIEGELTGFDPCEAVLERKVTFEQFQKGCEFSIMGCMYRNIYINNCEYYKNAITATRNACDLVISNIVLKHGPVYVMNECLGVYRVSGAKSSYCATTRQEKVDMDTILQLRELITLYGVNKYYRIKISQKSFDGMMFLVKRKLFKEIVEFWRKLSRKEKIYSIFYFPKNMCERIFLHIK